MNSFESFRKWFSRISWRFLLSWQFLKDPIAICTAIISGILIAILSNAFDPKETLSLVWIATTIILVMIFGSAERVLVEAIFRILGTFGGVGLGALIAFGHSQMVNQGVSAVALYSYQLSLMVSVVFLMAVFARLFPWIRDIFIIIALTTAILIFTPDLNFVHSRTLSILLAAGSAFLFTLLFQYTLAEEVLFQEHGDAAVSILKLSQYAISSEYPAKHEFEILAHRVRDSLKSTSVANWAYVQWRKWSCRRVVYDFESLAESLRPLFYEVFSLYWSHVETSLRPRDASRLYCDTEESYQALFRPLIWSIIQGVEKCEQSIHVILQHTKTASADRRFEIEDLVSAMSTHFYLNLQIMHIRYLDNRLVCFSNRYQRWNMCEYMITLACVLMEIVEYIKTVTQMFEFEDLGAYCDLIEKLSILKDHINQVRFEADNSIVVDVVPFMGGLE
jgi:hypothetical protein